MKKLLLFIILISVPLFAGEKISAEQTIQIGLQNNFDIRIARNNAEISRNNAGLGNAGLMPVIGAGGSAAITQSEQETNSTTGFGDSQTQSYNAQISLNWTLFDGFKMFLDKTRYSKLAELGEAQARNQIENYVVAILAAYFNLVQQEQRAEVNRQSLQISQDRLTKATVRHDVGGASSTDLLNARVSYNSDKSALINQELQVEIARKELNLLLGRQPDDSIAVEQEIIVPSLEMQMEELVELASQRNSQLISARLNKQIAAKEASIAISVFSPQLSLNGSYGYSDRTINPDNPKFPNDIYTRGTDATVSLNLSFNLFNGFRNKISLQNSRLAARNSELTYQKQQNTVRGLVLEKYRTFLKRVELLTLEQENRVAAQQNLDLQRDRYELGSATSLEFRDAQVNLLRSELALIAAKYQAKISRLEIEQLIGEIDIR